MDKKAADISPAIQATLTAIVKRELSSIVGLRYREKDIATIVKHLAQQRMSSGTTEAGLPQAFETTAIASKILGLYEGFKADGITLADSFAVFLKTPHLLGLHVKTLTANIEADCLAWQAIEATRQQALFYKFRYGRGSLTTRAAKNGALLSKLLLDGDLSPPPGARAPHNQSKAINIVLDNCTYSILLNFSIEEVYAVALFTKLADCTVRAAFQLCKNGNKIFLTNEDRSTEINKRLAVISDSKWESVKHLAEGAGFKRPMTLRPDRFAAIRAAQQRLHDKKFHL